MSEAKKVGMGFIGPQRRPILTVRKSEPKVTTPVPVAVLPPRVSSVVLLPTNDHARGQEKKVKKRKKLTPCEQILAESIERRNTELDRKYPVK